MKNKKRIVRKCVNVDYLSVERGLRSDKLMVQNKNIFQSFLSKTPLSKN